MTTTKLTLALFALCSTLTACDADEPHDRMESSEEIDAEQDDELAQDDERAFAAELVAEAELVDEAELEDESEGMDMLELVLLLEGGAGHCPQASYVSTDPEVCADLIVTCLPGWMNVPEQCGCGCFREESDLAFASAKRRSDP